MLCSPSNSTCAQFAPSKDGGVLAQFNCTACDPRVKQAHNVFHGLRRGGVVNHGSECAQVLGSKTADSHHIGANSGSEETWGGASFQRILKIALNNPLNLPLRIVRQLTKVTGEAFWPEPKCNCQPLIEPQICAPLAQIWFRLGQIGSSPLLR